MLLDFFFFKQKTAYDMRISDWSSDVCSSDLDRTFQAQRRAGAQFRLLVVRIAHSKSSCRIVGRSGPACFKRRWLLRGCFASYRVFVGSDKIQPAIERFAQSPGSIGVGQAAMYHILAAKGQRKYGPSERKNQTPQAHSFRPPAHR